MIPAHLPKTLSPRAAHLHPRSLSLVGARCVRVLAVLVTLGAGILPAQAAATLILWENLVGGGTPDSAALRDHDGSTRLAAGTIADGDGTVVALGYFTGSTDSAGFSGTWVPLTGPQAIHAPFRSTTIGDTGSAASGAYGFFSIQTTFDTSIPTSVQDLPAPGTRLAIAVFNGTSIGGSTHFNIATNEAWQWTAPAALPVVLQFNLNDAGTTWLGGAGTALRTAVAFTTFPGLPAIAVQPGNVGLNTGGDLLLSVTATGPGTLSYQWFKGGTALSGQTGTTLSLTGVSASDAGDYFVRVSNHVGPVDSRVARVAVHSSAARLQNISTRAFVGTDASLLIPGFVAVGTGNKPVLIRAVGPALGPLGVAGVLDDPSLSVRDVNNTILASNDNWSDQPDAAAVTAAMNATGAFPIPNGSLDAALLFNAPVNQNLTVHVTGVGATTGVALAEIYVVNDEASADSRLVNISTRGRVGTGDNVMIPGFFLGQGGTRRLLIRAVGPTLGALYPTIPPVIPDPVLRVRRSSTQEIVASNDDWEDDSQGAAIAAAAIQVQAFALHAGSADAAIILEVPPAVPDGSDRGFTVEVFDANGASGLAIAEVYELP